jgi:zinc protease
MEAIRHMRIGLPLPSLPALAVAASAAAAAPPAPRSFELDNGLTVVVIEDRRAPVAIQMVWYRVGSADDPPGQSGLAHFLEHLMFKATDALDEGAFSRVVAENGGSDNAFTTADYTAFVQRIAADRLGLLMRMEADRMADLAPTEAGVLSERDVVIEERREVVETDPAAGLAEECQAALYLNHPYGRPVIGWEQEIGALTRSAAMDFYRAHYAPNNAVLIVAGAVAADEVRRMAERHFGPIPASPAVATRQRPQEPQHRAPRRVEMQDARAGQPFLRRSYLAPPRRAGDQAEAAALAVLAELLGGSPVTSVLGRELVMGDGVALDAGASYTDTGLDPRTFDLHVVPKPGVGLAEAEAALDAALARFVAAGPEAGDLERIAGRVRAAEIYELDDLSARASRVGEGLTSGLTLDDIAAWPGLLRQVSAAEVQMAAASVLRIENSVTCSLDAPGPLPPGSPP